MSNRPNTRKSSRPVPPRPSAKKSSGPSRGLVIGAVVAVIVVLGVIAVAVTAGDDKVDAGPQTFPVQVTGEALPRLPDDNQDDTIGSPAPTVTGISLVGSTFEGPSVTIGGSGRPSVVMFLAHWCPHCQAEVPVITDWIGDNGMPEDVDLFAVSTAVSADAPNYPPSRWLDREDWPITTIADDENSSVATAFGLRGYPFFVALDAEGNVAFRTSGELTERQFEAVLDAARGS